MPRILHTKCIIETYFIGHIRESVTSNLRYFNFFATSDVYMRQMRQLFHCLQWYAGSGEKVNIVLSDLTAKDLFRNYSSQEIIAS